MPETGVDTCELYHHISVVDARSSSVSQIKYVYWGVGVFLEVYLEEVFLENKTPKDKLPKINPQMNHHN